jgi:citrate synthase
MEEKLVAESTGMPRAGLDGVEVAVTEVGDVRGREGSYHYRGYDAIELARSRSIEDVWCLLFEGELPDGARRSAFDDEIRSLRVIPEQVSEALPAVVASGSGAMFEDVRAAYALFAAARGFRPLVEIGEDDLRSQAMQSCAVYPTLAMAVHRLHSGLDPIAPRDDLPVTANYLYMLTGMEGRPEHVDALEKYLIATVEHGFNASTFSARVIASTGADLGSAVLGALGALSGPLHGGAPSRARAMLAEIGSKENAEAWLRSSVQSGGRLMGFGHRVYKTEDPRSGLLLEVAEELGAESLELARHVERSAVSILQELKPGRDLYTNVEFYAGIVLDLVGLPSALFTPTFAASRMIGWCAHIMEQAADNRLIRPSARYTGPQPGRRVRASL